MVKYLLPLLLLPLWLWGEVKIASEVDNRSAFTGAPVSGSVNITHPVSESVDESSFQLKGKPLKVTLAHTVAVSSNIQISFYTFTLPPEEKGLRLLPPVTVVVGGKRYESIASSYEVKNALPQKKAEAAAASLQLNGRIIAPTPFYPGQRALFVYEITYSKDITLTKEELPLLKAEGMSRIGEPQAETSRKDGKSVQKIVQIVKAVQPGDHTYGPSLIEGSAFTTDASGKKKTYGPLLSAPFPPISLTVMPLPENKPLSFGGAIGTYQSGVKLLTSPKVTVGDTMTLALAITGEDLENVKMPNLSCQPGWSGLFAANNLPPSITTKGKTRTFTLDVRPLTTQLKQIPPVAFSFFDPQKGNYVTLKSPPIPIEVAPAPEKEAPKVKEEAAEKKETEILENYPVSDLQSRFYHTSKVLWLLPAGLALLLLQIVLKNRWEEAKALPPTAEQLFQKALNTSQFYEALKKAFEQRLKELGEPPELSKEMAALLLKIERRLYTPGHEQRFDDLLEEAKTLFKRRGP